MTKHAIRRVRKKIGDVIEVKTTKGLAYVQYTHYHKERGTLIRILQKMYDERQNLKEIEKIINLPHRFQTFCMIYYSVNAGLCDVIGNFEVPDFMKKFPIFKGTNASPKSDPETVVWWLWDGEKEWKIGKLSKEEIKKYPYDGIANHNALLHNIETGLSAGRELC